MAEPVGQAGTAVLDAGPRHESGGALADTRVGEDEEHAVQMQDVVDVRLPRRTIATVNVVVDTSALRKRKPRAAFRPSTEDDVE